MNRRRTGRIHGSSGRRKIFRRNDSLPFSARDPFIVVKKQFPPGVLISPGLLHIKIGCLLLSLYLLYVFRNTLQGLGNAVAPLISGVMEFAARVSAAYFFTGIFGDEAIFFAEPSAWFAAMAVLIAFCLKAVRALPESPASENLS